MKQITVVLEIEEDELHSLADELNFVADNDSTIVIRHEGLTYFAKVESVKQ